MPGSASLLAASVALKVASLDLCADEYLLLLARPAEIASVCRVAHDPADSVLWRAARHYPANRRELESVIAARPNLLLMSRAGVRPDIAERVLGHIIAGVEGVYDRHRYDLEKAEALQRLALLIDNILVDRLDNIISFSGERIG